MGMIIKQGLFVALILFFSPVVLYAAWNSPKNIIEGQFGSADNNFGFAKGYIVDELPQILTIFQDGKILLWDQVQGKTKLFSIDGTLAKTLPYIGLKTEEVSVGSVYAFKFDPSAKATYAGVYSVSENKWLWFDESINIVTSYCDFSRAFPHPVFTTIPPGTAL
jgi:hypothetical protein